MTNDVQGSHAPDYVAIGFEQIDRDLEFLISCFREVLIGLGHDRLAAHLPWVGSPPGDTQVDELPDELGLAFAVAFQLLNMVEESAAASMRRLRESHEGLNAERGLWGNQLCRLKEEGFGASEIARSMAQVRVEPVLTAHPTEAKRLACAGPASSSLFDP
jgi:phosphoenolpyruvate carboxylase